MTLGIGEPFTTTLTVTLIFALILSLPVLLAQAYAFLMPAFGPEQRRRMLPITVAIPLLFILGVAFGYFVVLPAAVHFFQNFNSGQFNVLVQAGPVLQVRRYDPAGHGPAVPDAGRDPRRHRRGRGHPAPAAAATAATRSAPAPRSRPSCPGDAMTMLLETVPLYLLFELSVLLASLAERRARRAERQAVPV